MPRPAVATTRQMVEIHITQLEDERIRYNGDTWAFTGDINVKQNGAVIEARATKPDRVRRSKGTMRFQLQNPPASLNPGNPGEFDVKLGLEGNDTVLELIRPHANDRYVLKSVSYN